MTVTHEIEASSITVPVDAAEASPFSAEPFSPEPFSAEPFADDLPLRPRRRHRRQAVIVWVASGLATALVVVALLFQLAGGRWFIVETPSMGTAAPVGTLVLTTPVKATDLRVGDVVTFHPPTEPKESYTHRIVAISASGAISTRGDINGATDPWTLSQHDIVGKATTLLPRVGWLVRALPILLVGSTFVLLVTALVRTPSRRVSYRILGLSMIGSLTVYVLKPLVGLVVLTAQATKNGAQAQVVSTGILPIKVSIPHGGTVDLVSGQVGTIDVPAAATPAGYHLASSLNLSLAEWVVFGAICAVPMLWCFIVGLPTEPDYSVDADEAAAAEAYVARAAALAAEASTASADGSGLDGTGLDGTDPDRARPDRADADLAGFDRLVAG